MLPNDEKLRKLIRLEVDFKPPGRARPYKYPILITQTKKFNADRINQVAQGEVHDQSVIQRKLSCFFQLTSEVSWFYSEF